MTIKSDKWIKTKALELDMIKPFQPNQVRKNESEKLISYGLSSYGYDESCTEDYKIFTNIKSATVDPKSIDPDSLEDYKGTE